ncbi:MAG: heat-inducible transcription repressor HrcA [Erysipelothrix sp.]|nr:heat-inducible transcription repressor HrcA [Erysipelothrix sp.]
MLTQRRIEIFKTIVREFIDTAEPVGSKTLIEKYGLNYSSATVRNEMSALEKMELIEKTHTSSGRVPSTKGYRFYVEHLMEDTHDEIIEKALVTVFNDRAKNVDEALKQGMDLLVQMTDLTTAVLGPDANHQRLQEIVLSKIDDQRAIVLFETDQPHSESRLFHLNGDLTFEDLEFTVNLFNQRLFGTTLTDVIPKMEAIRPILAETIKSYEKLFEAFANTIVRFYNDNVVFSGQSNLLNQPEFDNINKLKQLIAMMEDSALWREVSRGKGDMMLQTSKHSQTVWFDELAVVSSEIKLNDVKDNVRQLMIVGPSRMEYDRVVSLLEYVRKMVEEVYGSDEGE